MVKLFQHQPSAIFQLLFSLLTRKQSLLLQTIAYLLCFVSFRCFYWQATGRNSKLVRRHRRISWRGGGEGSQLRNGSCTHPGINPIKLHFAIRDVLATFWMHNLRHLICTNESALVSI